MSKFLIDVTKLPIQDGENLISASAYSTGLDWSRLSKGTPLDGGSFVYSRPEGADYLIITGLGTVTARSIVIPLTHEFEGEDLPVKEIGASAFLEVKSIESVTIPPNITKIGANAFGRCLYLQELKIEANSQLETIDESAFSNCNIQSLNIPASVKTIGKSAFMGNSAMKSLTFEDTMTLFFRVNSNLANIHGSRWAAPHCYYKIINPESGATDFIDNVWPGKAMSFVGTDNGENIYSITIPGYVNEIIFNNGDKLNTQQTPKIETINNDNIYHGACFQFGEDNTIENYDYNGDLPGMSIGSYAFGSLNSINSIYLPNHVKSISSYAFYDCSELHTLYVGSGLMSIGDSAFEECVKLQFVKLNEHRSISPYKVDGNTVYLVQNKVRLDSIGNKAFYSAGTNGDTLTEITIPASVTWIGTGAFANTSLDDGAYDDKGVLFEDIYGWFKTEDSIKDYGRPIKPEMVADKVNITFDLEQNTVYNWYKLDQMPAPTLTIEGTTLTITDKTTIAEEFKIYVAGENGEPIHRATYNVKSETLTLV